MSDESRAYPSPLYFEDRLRIEVEKAQNTVKSLDEALAQLRVIWAVKHREAVLSFIENLRPRRTFSLPEEVQPQVADALTDLVDATNGLKPGQRHRADQTVSRLIKYLAPARQIEIIWPWMQDNRPFRVSTVIRTIQTLDDYNPYADYLIRHYRASRSNLLPLIARTPEAARQVMPDELMIFFDAYIEKFKSGENKPKDPSDGFLDFEVFEGYTRTVLYKTTKYSAMLAAKTLIIGGNTIPVDLLRRIPEVFSWAVDQIADVAHESLLVFLIVENHESPELLWSAIRTAQRLRMHTALERGLDAARAFLNIPKPTEEDTVATVVQHRLPGN